MIWFFERETETLRYEIRREMTGHNFEVVITEGAGERREKVTSPTELLERSQQMWTGLMGSGWRPLGPELWPVTPIL